MYNNDMFAGRKCVHIKLRTDNLETFRAELLRRRLSMQEVFDEFATLVAFSDPGALKILDRIVYNKNREKMERILGPSVEPTEQQSRNLGKNRHEAPKSTEESFFDMIEKASALKKGEP